MQHDRLFISLGPRHPTLAVTAADSYLLMRNEGNAQPGLIDFPADPPSSNEPALQGQVEKLNRQNTEHSHGNAEAGNQTSESRSEAGVQKQAAELIPDGPHASSTVQSGDKEPRETEEDDEDIFEDSESEEETQDRKTLDDVKKKDEDDGKETSPSVASSLPVERYLLSLVLKLGCQYSKSCPALMERASFCSPPTSHSSDEAADVAACSKRRVASEEDLLKDDLKKSRVEESGADTTEGKSVEESESRAPESEEVKVEAEETAADSAVEEFTIGEACETIFTGP